MSKDDRQFYSVLMLIFALVVSITAIMSYRSYAINREAFANGYVQQQRAGTTCLMWALPTSDRCPGCGAMVAMPR
jgi:hypothetical protein